MQLWCGRSMCVAQREFDELLNLLSRTMQRDVFFPGDVISQDDGAGAMRMLRTGRVGEYVGDIRFGEIQGPAVISTSSVFGDGDSISGKRLIADTPCEARPAAFY